MKIVLPAVYFLPEYALAVGYVRNSRAVLDVKRQHSWKDVGIGPDVRRHDEIRGRDAVRSLSSRRGRFFRAVIQILLPGRHFSSSVPNSFSRMALIASAIFTRRRAQSALIAEWRSAETSMVKRFIATGDPYSTGGRSLTARSLGTFLSLFFIIYDFTTAEKKTSSRAPTARWCRADDICRSALRFFADRRAGDGWRWPKGRGAERPSIHGRRSAAASRTSRRAWPTRYRGSDSRS